MKQIHHGNNNNLFRDDGGADDGNHMNDDEGNGEGGVDQDALAFIRAKKKVDDLHKAKKIEKKGGVF